MSASIGGDQIRRDWRIKSLGVSLALRFLIADARCATVLFRKHSSESFLNAAPFVCLAMSYFVFSLQDFNFSV